MNYKRPCVFHPSSVRTLRPCLCCCNTPPHVVDPDSGLWTWLPTSHTTSPDPQIVVQCHYKPQSVHRGEAVGAAEDCYNHCHWEEHIYPFPLYYDAFIKVYTINHRNKVWIFWLVCASWGTPQLRRLWCSPSLLVTQHCSLDHNTWYGFDLANIGSEVTTVRSEGTRGCDQVTTDQAWGWSHVWCSCVSWPLRHINTAGSRQRQYLSTDKVKYQLFKKRLEAILNLLCPKYIRTFLYS